MFKNITSGLFSPTLILCNRRKPILLFAKFLLRISQSWRFGKMDYNLINPTTIPVSRHKLLCIGIFLWKERWKVVWRQWVSNPFPFVVHSWIKPLPPFPSFMKRNEERFQKQQKNTLWTSAENNWAVCHRECYPPLCSPNCLLNGWVEKDQ